MKQKGNILIILIVILIALWLVFRNHTSMPSSEEVRPDVMSISDGTITIAYDPDTFGLATSPEQILTKSYIPPCAEGFTYCLYYKRDAYKDTNFESAGVTIKKRDDLATERLCTQTPPTGYADVLPDHTGSTDFTTYSVFENIGDAAAGHYANGNNYRLFVRDTNTCYDVITRISQSQFANYPAGTIKEFTKTDEGYIKDGLEHIVEVISYKGKFGLFYSED